MIEPWNKQSLAEVQNKVNLAIDGIKIIELGNDKRVLVEYKGNLYNQRYNNLYKGKIPSIKSAIDKNAVFISKAKEVHGDSYIYDKVEYVSAKKHITITCPVHGDFEQTPDGHLSGQGCKLCADAKKANTWSYSDWEKAGRTSSNFDGFKLYLIECWNDEERFFKIGKTYRRMDYRLPKNNNFNLFIV